jgi:multicomponent Na+:H+ antiporter subunit E
MLKIYYILGFIVFYLLKLIQSNIVIAYDILTPKMSIKPGLIEVPLTLKSDFGLLLFSNLLSMTPGTLVMDIDENREIALVHVLYLTSSAEILNEINEIQDKIGRFTE